MEIWLAIPIEISYICRVKTKYRVISLFLVFLVFNTNIVVSIESIYCFCFKTTKYALAISDDVCCSKHLKNDCDKKDCCNVSLKKLPCKSKSTITLNSKTEFTSSVNNSTDFSKAFIHEIFVLIPKQFSESNALISYYSDPSPPNYLKSHPFLQSFLC